MLSSRLNAFEMPISQTTAIASRDHLVVDDLDVRTGGEDDRRRAALGGELRERPDAAEVVGEPGEEDERDPGVDRRRSALSG